jgi:hypothetical protein
MNAHAIQMAVDSQLEIGNMLLLLTAHIAFVQWPIATLVSICTS